MKTLKFRHNIAPAGLLATLLLGATSAAADGPTRFHAAIDGYGVARHRIEVQRGTTWAVSIATQSAATKMFVSTDARFSPHDAACSAERSCTVSVEDSDELYVFVLSEESSQYDVLATPTQVRASL